jgi:site-specific DNA recombinase
MNLINREIEKQKQRIQNAKSLMLDGEFSANEFKEIRIEIEEKITKLTCELSRLNSGMQNLDTKLAGCVELLSDIDKYYEQRDVATKQKIVSSIFPAKLIYDKKIVRTLHVNRVVSLICSNNRASRFRKKENHTDFGVLSHRVEYRGIEPLTSCLPGKRSSQMS